MDAWKIRLAVEFKKYLKKPNFRRLKVTDSYSIIIFHKHHFFTNGNYVTFQTYNFYRTDSKSLYNQPLELHQEFKNFQKDMFFANNIFPKELFPKRTNPQDEDEEVSYDFFLGEYV